MISLSIFLKQIAKDQPAQNIFISPYSAATVLQMVANGAAGQIGNRKCSRCSPTTNLSIADVNAANKGALSNR